MERFIEELYLGLFDFRIMFSIYFCLVYWFVCRRIIINGKVEILIGGLILFCVFRFSGLMFVYIFLLVGSFYFRIGFFV